MYPHLQLSPLTPIKTTAVHDRHFTHYSSVNNVHDRALRTPSIADLAMAFLANGTHPIAYHHRRLALRPEAILAMTIGLFVMRMAICWLAVQYDVVAIGPTDILAGKWWVTGYVSNLRNSLGDIYRLTVPRLSLESFLVDTLFNHHDMAVDSEQRLLLIRRAVKCVYGLVVLLSVSLMIVAFVRTRHMQTMHQQSDPIMTIPMWTIILMIPMDPSVSLCVMSPCRSLHFIAYLIYLLTGVSMLVSVAGGGGVKLTGLFTMIHTIPYILAVWKLTAFKKQKIIIVHDML